MDSCGGNGSVMVVEGADAASHWHVEDCQSTLCSPCRGRDVVSLCGMPSRQLETAPPAAGIAEVLDHLASLAMEFKLFGSDEPGIKLAGRARFRVSTRYPMSFYGRPSPKMACPGLGDNINECRKVRLGI